MGSIYLSQRISASNAPTRIALPNIPLEYGRRRQLSSLVPIYADTFLSGPKEIPTKLHFVHLAIAIQISNEGWLQKVLTNYPKGLPIRDETTGITLLHIAAKLGSESTLTVLFKNDEILQLLNQADVRGTTPLIAAAWYGNFPALKYFLALGCETSSCIYDSRQNALHCAASLTDTQLCSQLLKYNNKRSFIDAVDNEGYTPLMIAVREGSPCASILLMAGANYRFQSNVSGRNILHLAIVFFQNDILVKLVRAFNDVSFISAVDFNGDNPFMLAARLKNYTAVKILINNIPVNKLLTSCKHCIHYLIKFDCSDVLGIIMAAAKEVDFLDWIDSKGRNPLMYAVEIQRTDYVRDILRRQKHLRYRNPFNGETVLHLAAYASNAEIMMSLLSSKGVEEIINICDHGGRTAYEIVLSRADQSCYYAFKDSGYVIPEFFNSKNESSLFIAAKLGNYNLVLNLLLSEKFLAFHSDFPEFTKLELIRAELQGLIYSSDTFIVCGEKSNLLHSWNRVPKQDHLFQHNADNKNIFHACVMGEELMCLIFIYSYCVHFNDRWQELDMPDNEGTTPLLYSTKSGQREICKFLIQHGANITFKNNKGVFPLLEMTKHISDHINLLLNMINECVVEDTSKKRMGMSSGVISVTYHIFCPPGVRQMHVVTKFFEVFKGAPSFGILQNSVIEYLIEVKWVKLKYIIAVRLYVNILTVLFTYTYMTMTLWWFSTPAFVLSVIRMLTLFFSITSILISVPYLFIRSTSWGRRVFSVSIILSPFCTIAYLYMEQNSVLSLEVGSVAVLSTGVSVFIHSIDTSLGQQISMFYEVLSGIRSHLPLSAILLLSFSLCFFVLYHSSFNFNSPLTSFLYTVMVLLEGDSGDVPLFKPDYFTSNTSQDNQQTDRRGVNIKNGLSIVFEGSLLILFKILVTISLLNMLIGLSVRGANELEIGGNVQRLKTKATVLHEWESFSQSCFYRWLSKYHLYCIFGLIPNLMEQLEIPTVVFPHEYLLKSFDVNKLQNIAIKQEDITSIELKFLAEEIGYQPKFPLPKTVA